MNIMPKLFGATFAAIAAVSTAFAQSDAPTNETDPVLVFNRVCYAQVPVIDNIRDMSARFAWEVMGGDDLKQFTTIENPDVLEGWDVRIARKLYRLGIVQSPLTDSFKEAFPDFRDGVATGCTLILDGNDEADVILARMNTLAGKEPASSGVPDGKLLTTNWAGGNEDFKVFLIFKSGDNGKAHLLNVTILAKEKI